MSSTCISFLLSSPPFLPSLLPRYTSTARHSTRRGGERHRFSFSRSFVASLRFSCHGTGKHIEVARALKFDGPVMDTDTLELTEDDDLMVEVCVTRTLPPALTLERGLESLKEAIDELKSNPPRSCSGVMRFQVAVPPRAKALYWFCCQPISSGVFPVFFLSKDNLKPSYKSLYLKEPHGVFGIGAALSFVPSSSNDSKGHIRKRKFLSDDSVMVTAYGFPDIDFIESPTVNSKDACSYSFVPQIELDEREEVSILAVTLAWNDSLSCRFENTINAYEKSFFQVSCHFCPTLDGRWFKHLKSSLAKLSVKGIHPTKMEHMGFFTFSGKHQADAKELVSSLP